MSTLDSNKTNKLSILITVILFVLIHTGAAIWWASTVTNKIDSISVQLDEKIKNINDKVTLNSNQKYDKAQAVADFATRDQRITSIEKQTDILSKQFDMQLGEVKQLIQQLNNKFDTFIINFYQSGKNKE